MSERSGHISLLYHDVIGEDPAASGFPGAAADRYKLTRSAFGQHLDAIALRQPSPATSIFAAAGPSSFHITFDDGGASSLWIADALERRGWIGHFFVPTDWIGKPGFLDAAGIRELAQRGHIVGSHSCSHPLRMASLPDAVLFREWVESRKRLADILGQSVACASIPGGGYALRVAEAVEAAGYSHLFTSEPSAQPWLVDRLKLLGRFSVMAATPPRAAAALAIADPKATLKLRLAWQMKRAIKSVIGSAWEQTRDSVLKRAPAK